MSKVVVIGHINHDRVWSLAAPLTAGGRISYLERRVRLGGGGFYTGSALLRLGRPVSLISNLHDDGNGLTALARLLEMGFDTRHVAVLAGETALTEILLDPAGERTILTTGGQLRPTFTLTEPMASDAAYLNALALDERLVASLDHTPLVVSQFPLRPATPRPADFMVGSKADFPGEKIEDLWHRARGIAGPRLAMLVLTDGLRPISFYDGHRLTQVGPFVEISNTDTIGAGDTFAGAFLHGLLGGLDVELAAEKASDLTADWLRNRSSIGQFDIEDRP